MRKSLQILYGIIICFCISMLIHHCYIYYINKQWVTNDIDFIDMQWGMVHVGSVIFLIFVYLIQIYKQRIQILSQWSLFKCIFLLCVPFVFFISTYSTLTIILFEHQDNRNNNNAIFIGYFVCFVVYFVLNLLMLIHDFKQDIIITNDGNMLELVEPPTKTTQVTSVEPPTKTTQDTKSELNMESESETSTDTVNLRKKQFAKQMITKNKFFIKNSNDSLIDEKNFLIIFSKTIPFSSDSAIGEVHNELEYAYKNKYPLKTDDNLNTDKYIFECLGMFLQLASQILILKHIYINKDRWYIVQLFIRESDTMKTLKLQKMHLAPIFYNLNYMMQITFDIPKSIYQQYEKFKIDFNTFVKSVGIFWIYECKKQLYFNKHNKAFDRKTFNIPHLNQVEYLNGVSKGYLSGNEQVQWEKFVNNCHKTQQDIANDSRYPDKSSLVARYL